jgi:hypothetical protein
LTASTSWCSSSPAKTAFRSLRVLGRLIALRGPTGSPGHRGRHRLRRQQRSTRRQRLALGVRVGQLLRDGDHPRLQAGHGDDATVRVDPQQVVAGRVRHQGAAVGQGGDTVGDQTMQPTTPSLWLRPSVQRPPIGTYVQGLWVLK